MIRTVFDHCGDDPIASTTVCTNVSPSEMFPGVLLRGGAVVRIDEREARELSGARVGQELRHRLDVGRVVLDVRHRVQVHRFVDPRDDLGVVRPADAVARERVEDRPVRRGERERRQLAGVGDVVRHPHGGRGEQEAPIGIRLPEHAAEPAIADRELRRQRVCEGKVVLVPVAHRHRPARRDHEAVVRAVRVLLVGGGPLLAGRAARLAGIRHVERTLRRAVGLRVGRGRIAVRRDREAVTARRLERPAPEHPEEVVVRVVLHHQHDHVLDLGQHVGAGRDRGIRPGSRHPHVRAPEYAQRLALGGERLLHAREPADARDRTPARELPDHRRRRQGSGTVGQERTPGAP